MITYSANIIAESMYDQCDEERQKYLFLDQCWITKQMGMPYWWRIKIWVYVGEVRNAKPQKVGTCVSNGRMGQQHGRGCQTSRNTIPFRLESNHLHRGSDTSLLSIGG